MSRRDPNQPGRHDTRVIHQVASWCLAYPTGDLLDRIPVLRAATESLPPGDVRDDLERFLHYLTETPIGQLQRRYVDVFDLSRKHALYLSYWTDGDTRRRGEVLLAFKERYRASGFLVDTHGELTDYLPLVLEYAALADPTDGLALLQEYRASLELLRLGLLESDPTYAALVTAVCSTLPGASPVDRAAVHAMAAAGPPQEDVGLEPYDPRLLPLSPGGAR
ncbi:MAG TPA: nitrate reductase molybdenum cofactor assembly chaperone [Dermatophilaceae bacterium]|nr:nitrate reductase molybdenum cofactor assembly chaperone [Dermatophilaceae bacterium]